MYFQEVYIVNFPDRVEKYCICVSMVTYIGQLCHSSLVYFITWINIQQNFIKNTEIDTIEMIIIRYIFQRRNILWTLQLPWTTRPVKMM